MVHLQTRPNLHDGQRPLSDYTVRGRAAALSAFASFLAEDGYTEDNVLASFTLPKLGKRQLVVLDEAEIDHVLTACNHRTARGFRNLCIVSTLLDTGLRCFELATSPSNCDGLSTKVHQERRLLASTIADTIFSIIG